MEHTTIVDAPVGEVIAWLGRRGAIERLLPPWQPLKVLQESTSLSDGTAILRLPMGIRWTARHQPAEYRPDRRFVDRLETPVLDRIVPWVHVHEVEPVSATRTKVVDRIETRVPNRFLAENLAYRGRQMQGDLAAHRAVAELVDGPMTIAVTGSSGLIGTALCAFLTTGGHRVIRLVRGTPRGPGERRWDPGDPADDLLDGVDAVVHLAGASVAGRFTAAHRRTVYDTRVAPTRLLARLVGDRTFVVASATGIYGPDRGDEVLTEASERGDGFLADLVADWEAAADPARRSGARVVHLRTGIVQSPRGGVLKALRPLFELGGGGRLGDGSQWMPWIGIDDVVDIYLRALVDERLHGPVNACAPVAERNDAYARTLARVLRRPAALPVPARVVRLLAGATAAREFVLAGQNIRPTILESLDHRFRFRGLEPALRHVLGRFLTDRMADASRSPT